MRRIRVGCLGLSVLSMSEGYSLNSRNKKAPGNFDVNPRLSPTPRQVEVSLLLTERQGVTGMKPTKTVVICLLIVCVTLIAITLLTRRNLCEVKIRNDKQEVAARLACSE
ncbi:Hok/Gef family protein [Buttiauxella sp. A111]|uniref:Hok/Gef family protein n=1 Tax=Buttiauxella sp. A111 TaxID=2563088 RepID=UPI00280A86F1|nr:Hok/Gef family protein [Buttiauxella sp. A111]